MCLLYANIDLFESMKGRWTKNSFLVGQPSLPLFLVFIFSNNPKILHELNMKIIRPPQKTFFLEIEVSLTIEKES